MTTFAELSSGAAAPGIYAGATVPDDAAALAEAEGWTVATVAREPRNGWTSTTDLKRETLAALADALRFPDYFGGNLDALADCLRDVDVRTMLLWKQSHLLARLDAGTFGAIVEILGDRAADAAAPAFCVVLVGGPPIDGLESLTG